MLGVVVYTFTHIVRRQRQAKLWILGQPGIHSKKPVSKKMDSNGTTRLTFSFCNIKISRNKKKTNWN